MTTLHRIAALIFFLLPFCISAQECGERYKSYISSGITTEKDIQYGYNLDNKGVPINLLLDVYQPADDTASLRPLMIFVHGGSFVGGSKTHGQQDDIARDFARRGYVTSSINYRVQRSVIEIIDPILEFADRSNWYRAIARGMHDIKASIRYFKKQAAENGNPYRIDTNNIVIYGSSAGAIASLHAVYLTDLEDALPVFKAAVNELGGLDGNSGNPGYSSTTGIRAVVSSSGAMSERRWMANRSDVAFLSVHHSVDPTVPYDFGCFVTAACHLGRFYGSKPLSEEASLLGIKHEFYTLEGVGHPADDNEPAFMKEKMLPFLYDLQCSYKQGATLVKSNALQEIKVYPNPTRHTFSAILPVAFAQFPYTMEVYNIAGAKVFEQRFQATSSVVEYTLPLQPGNFIVKWQSASTASPVMSKLVVMP